MKTIAILLFGFSSMFYPVTGAQETVLDGTWKTACEFKLDGDMTLYTGIVNLGDSPATDCKVDTWDGDSWEASGLTIPGCATLASGAELLWARTEVSPNNKFRVQMKSDAGTTVECALYRRR